MRGAIATGSKGGGASMFNRARKRLQHAGIRTSGAAGESPDVQSNIDLAKNASTIQSEPHSTSSMVKQLRFFGGLSVDETAEVLKVSAITVMRDWQFAKAWLTREVMQADGQ